MENKTKLNHLKKLKHKYILPFIYFIFTLISIKYYGDEYIVAGLTNLPGIYIILFIKGILGIGSHSIIYFIMDCGSKTQNSCRKT